MPQPSRVKRTLAALALACGTPLAVAAPAHVAMAEPAVTGLTCSTHELHVRITDPGPADQTLWGRLCYPGTARPATVQLLVHGFTYNHLYWDFPVRNDRYSYVKAAAAAGYATFNVDRIGEGGSSHPPSDQLNLTAGAVALHDAITALRSGALDGHAFSRVVWVGHSQGSFHGWYELSRYRDVDAAVLTGSLHAGNPEGAEIIHPALEDPKFADSGLDPGYVTTLPGTRGFFYDPATSEPDVIAADEAAKDVGTLTPGPALPVPMDFTAPVLLVSGQRDRGQCVNVTEYNCADPATVLAFESQFYRPETHLSVRMIPETGHDLALSTTAPVTDAVMLGWIRSTLAR